MYFIKKGEFELCKKLPRNELPKGYDVNEDWLPQGPKNLLAMRIPEMSDFPYMHRINILGVGNAAGEEDVISRQNFSCSLICYSQKGTVYRMKKEHFILLKHTEHAWIEVISKITYKEYRAEGLDLRDEKKIVRKSSARKLIEEEEKADEDIWEVMTSPKLQRFNRP